MLSTITQKRKNNFSLFYTNIRIMIYKHNVLFCYCDIDEDSISYIGTKTRNFSEGNN